MTRKKSWWLASLAMKRLDEAVRRCFGCAGRWEDVNVTQIVASLFSWSIEVSSLFQSCVHKSQNTNEEMATCVCCSNVSGPVQFFARENFHWHKNPPEPGGRALDLNARCLHQPLVSETDPWVWTRRWTPRRICCRSRRPHSARACICQKGTWTTTQLAMRWTTACMEMCLHVPGWGATLNYFLPGVLSHCLGWKTSIPLGWRGSVARMGLVWRTSGGQEQGLWRMFLGSEFPVHLNDASRSIQEPFNIPTLAPNLEVWFRNKASAFVYFVGATDCTFSNGCTQPPYELRKAFHFSRKVGKSWFSWGNIPGVQVECFVVQCRHSAFKFTELYNRAVPVVRSRPLWPAVTAMVQLCLWAMISVLVFRWFEELGPICELLEKASEIRASEIKSPIGRVFQKYVYTCFIVKMRINVGSFRLF